MNGQDYNLTLTVGDKFTLTPPRQRDLPITIRLDRVGDGPLFPVVLNVSCKDGVAMTINPQDHGGTEYDVDDPDSPEDVDLKVWLGEYNQQTQRQS